MPELPEVETTRRGLEPHVTGAIITGTVIRNRRLRWPIPDLALQGLKIQRLTRRAKYLLLDCGSGTLILHLGMSGSLRILPLDAPIKPHDHFDLLLDNGKLMRLHDPRRFGAVLWHEGDINSHTLLANLGPEPLEENFDGRYLHRATRNRKVSIKQCLMDNHVVVGVGNIYANESLFRSGIKPQLPAGKLSLPRCVRLVAEIRATLAESIEKGGSTLRDFVNSNGQPGYFQQNYWVYGLAKEPCRRCGTAIKQITQGQRSSFYCGICQK